MNFAKIDFLYTVQRTGETVETTFDTPDGLGPDADPSPAGALQRRLRRGFALG